MGNEMEECRRVNNWLKGCNFEARFDKLAPDSTKLPGLTSVARAETLCPKIYVRDVCTTCGKTIERLK